MVSEGDAHVQSEGDVPFGDGSWGWAVESFMLKFLGAPVGAQIRYRATFGHSFQTGTPGFNSLLLLMLCCPWA